LRKEEFTLEDFRDQLKQIRKMGPLDKIVDMLPKMDRCRIFQGCESRRGQLTRVEAIINSMTESGAPGPQRHRRQTAKTHCQRERHHRAGREHRPQAVSANRTMMKQYGAMAARTKMKGLGKLAGLPELP